MKYLDELIERSAELDKLAVAPKAGAKSAPSDGPCELTPEQLALVEPGLEAFYVYLEELCEVLSLRSPKVEVGYEIMGMTTLSNLNQSDYKLVAESTVIPRFRFSLLCMAKTGTSVSVGTEHELDEVRGYLDLHNLRHRVENQSKMRFVVRVEGFVGVSFLFEPHPTEAKVKITARHLDRLGYTHYSIEPGKINRELMDEFGKRVLRMENNFDQLTGFAVSEEVRAQFKQRIAARQAQRDADVTGKRPKAEPRPNANEQGAEQPAATLKASAASKIGSLFRFGASRKKATNGGGEMRTRIHPPIRRRVPALTTRGWSQRISRPTIPMLRLGS